MGKELAGQLFPSKHRATMNVPGNPRLKDQQVAREVRYSDAAPMIEQVTSSRSKKWSVALLVVILSVGIFLRIWPSAGFRQFGDDARVQNPPGALAQKSGIWVGKDERAYSTYVAMAQKDGIWNFGDVVHAYVQLQTKRSDAIVPATRVGFLVPATIVAEITRLDPLAALRCTSLISSILLLLATALIGYRLGGSECMLLLTALMAVAPLQIHLAHLSLIDGYFAFWAVLSAWLLWENLQAQRQQGWLVAYGFSLFMLVLTKENAAFVFLALVTVSVVFAFRKLSFLLILVSVIAPMLAVLLLAGLVGGVAEWISFYRAFAQKSAALSYVILYQDGAWYRYLVDFTLLSPCIVVLAVGSLFRIRQESKPDIFWALFLGVSYVTMSSVPYGMSLRFAAYWDVPLRWLAVSQVIHLTRRIGKERPLFISVTILAILIAIDLFQYWRYFVHGQIYDPVSFQLLRASKLVK